MCRLEEQIPSWVMLCGVYLYLPIAQQSFLVLMLPMPNQEFIVPQLQRYKICLMSLMFFILVYSLWLVVSTLGGSGMLFPLLFPLLWFVAHQRWILLSMSVVQVVASMDWPIVKKYKGLVSAQGHQEEIIQDLYKVVEHPKKGRIHSGMIR